MEAKEKKTEDSRTTPFRVNPYLTVKERNAKQLEIMHNLRSANPTLTNKLQFVVKQGKNANAFE
jgi:hypothetical protein